MVFFLVRVASVCRAADRRRVRSGNTESVPLRHRGRRPQGVGGGWRWGPRPSLSGGGGITRITNRGREGSDQKSQPRTGHTREPDPTHLKLRHRTTRRTATHERTHTKQTSLTHSHTHTSRSENDVRRRHRPPHTHTHTQPRAWGTIACAISTDHSASASARRAPSRCTCRSRPTWSSWRRVRPAYCDWR